MPWLHLNKEKRSILPAKRRVNYCLWWFRWEKENFWSFFCLLADIGFIRDSLTCGSADGKFWTGRLWAQYSSFFFLGVFFPPWKYVYKKIAILLDCFAVLWLLLKSGDYFWRYCFKTWFRIEFSLIVKLSVFTLQVRWHSYL